MKRFFRVGIVVLTFTVVGLLGLAGECWAAGKFDTIDVGILNKDLPYREGLEFDHFTVHAALKSSVDMETNIFWSDTSEKYDVITNLTPSVGIEIPVGDDLSLIHI